MRIGVCRRQLFLKTRNPGYLCGIFKREGNSYKSCTRGHLILSTGQSRAQSTPGRQRPQRTLHQAPRTMTIF